MALLTPPVWLENSTAHNARDYRVMLRGITSGASGVLGVNALKVTQRSTADMSVDVGAGGALIASTRSEAQGSYHAYNDATVNLPLSASDPTNPRIDRIIVQVRDEAQDPAFTTNDAQLVVVEGTPAAVPSAPAITVQDYVELAQVTVPASATSITNANITDERDRADQTAGEWRTYTPTVANATLVPGYIARYSYVGKNTVTVWFQGQLASITNPLFVGLPIMPHATWLNRKGFHGATLLKASGADLMGTMLIQTNQTVTFWTTPAGTTPATPVPWGTGHLSVNDSVMFTLTYQV